MSLQYYYDLLSQPARAVYLFLKVNNIPFVDKPVSLLKGEQYSEDFTKINPLHKIPVIIDDGFILTESVAILKYLARKWNVADHWYPRDLHQQARVDEYLNWQHLNTRMNASSLFRKILIEPNLFKRPVNPDEVNHFRSETGETVRFLDAFFLKDQPYLCGGEASIADLLGACELMQLYGVGEEDLFRSNPKVSSWLDRVKGQLQPLFDEAHKGVFEVRKEFPQK